MGNRSGLLFKMIDPKKISILDYTYTLPSDRIALHPLAERDSSKLLVYQNGNLAEDSYKNIAKHFPAESLLVFNNTKVIKARILFTKPGGGIIEIFLLEPFQADYTGSLSATNNTCWKCMIGGISKWKDRELCLRINDYELKAEKKEKLSDAWVIAFNWEGGMSFAEILEYAGGIPLPPYIKRNTEEADAERYQTIYAKDAGSVAAPTAGLHFTQHIFRQLEEKNIKTDYVTLHVGAGTFKPVKAAVMQDHEMHAEWIDVSAAFISRLIEHLDNMVAAVGTTSLRTLESLYWMGVKAMLEPEIKQLDIRQWEVYERPLANTSYAAKAALTALLQWMKTNKREKLFTQSQILIAPGYHFKIAKAIITNFHQPQSTLLLLVAAAIGEDWRKVYSYAMQHDFRFLSYGDGSILFINQ